MAIYIVIWFLCLVLSNVRLPLGLQKSLYWGLCIIMVVIGGSRDIMVGTDTITYDDYYYNTRTIGYLYYVEPGWNLISLAASYFGLNFNGLLTCISVLTLLPVFYVSDKMLKNPFWAIFLYVSFHFWGASLNVMRQYFALSYILLGYYFYFKGHASRAQLILLAASTVHYSTILSFLFLLFAKKIKVPNKDKIILFSLLSLLVGLVIPIESILNITQVYADYDGSEKLYRQSFLTSALLAAVLLFFIASSLIFLKKSYRNNFWTKPIMVYGIMTGLTCKLLLAARISAIFGIAQIIFFPLFLNHNRLKYSLGKLMIILYSSISFFRILLVNGNGICPYKSILLP